jgi:hypothetical protein
MSEDVKELAALPTSRLREHFPLVQVPDGVGCGAGVVDRARRALPLRGSVKARRRRKVEEWAIGEELSDEQQGENDVVVRVRETRTAARERIQAQKRAPVSAHLARGAGSGRGSAVSGASKTNDKLQPPNRRQQRRRGKRGLATRGPQDPLLDALRTGGAAARGQSSDGDGDDNNNNDSDDDQGSQSYDDDVAAPRAGSNCAPAPSSSLSARARVTAAVSGMTSVEYVAEREGYMVPGAAVGVLIAREARERSAEGTWSSYRQPYVEHVPPSLAAAAAAAARPGDPGPPSARDVSLIVPARVADFVGYTGPHRGCDDHGHGHDRSHGHDDHAAAGRVGPPGGGGGDGGAAAAAANFAAPNEPASVVVGRPVVPHRGSGPVGRFAFPSAVLQAADVTLRRSRAQGAYHDGRVGDAGDRDDLLLDTTMNNAMDSAGGVAESQRSRPAAIPLVNVERAAAVATADERGRRVPNIDNSFFVRSPPSSKMANDVAGGSARSLTSLPTPCASEFDDFVLTDLPEGTRYAEEDPADRMRRDFLVDKVSMAIQLRERLERNGRQF